MNRVKIKELMSSQEIKREDDWASELKYHAARYAYRRKYLCTPKGVPWPIWFEQKFGESLSEFERRMNSRGAKKDYT